MTEEMENLKTQGVGGTPSNVRLDESGIDFSKSHIVFFFLQTAGKELEEPSISKAGQDGDIKFTK